MSIDHSNNSTPLELKKDTVLLALCGDSLQQISLHGLNNLIELNLAENTKIRLEDSFIPPSVQRIDATNCNLELDLQNLTQLRKLYISLQSNVTFKNGCIPLQVFKFWTPNQKTFHSFLKLVEVHSQIQQLKDCK
ncbi:hypothetical protein SS50377_27286 [Spironucleus salmonicida]|uniref:Uncharacterized protein n=1 Tax=Spironucleus salmonicida TaxID=348837 RepID=V6LI91_9EUKA|nr:hypothetical protein SS50377_27276 [Spironucleus salmonicida]KAH0570992.1 hypothetical protein SS50377_27286 [Spironucleus salmonicida]|eukprot:EST44295.1 Hypothetical protein SS50377_15829 [Spironucleus salmonicida]